VLNAVMREFLPPLQAELDEMDIKHTCGADFRLAWLNRDGIIWRWVADMDRMECVLTACCDYERSVRYCPHRDTSFNYLKLGIDGSIMARYNGDVLRLVKQELEIGWSDFKRHLETVAMPCWDRAIMRALEDSALQHPPELPHHGQRRLDRAELSVGLFQINTRRYGKVYDLAQLHARVQITPPNMKSAGPGAFLNALQVEMNALRDELKDSLARDIYGGWADRWELSVQRALDVIL
jgi:hypothetical protein